MANSTPADKTPEQPPVPSVGVDVLAHALTQAINATKPAAKITVANRIPQNPMNPRNQRRAFKTTFYQNYDRIDAEDVTDEEYELLPQLKPGLFLADGKEGYLIEIVEVKRGAQRGIHIRYNNAKIDTRMALMARVPTLAAMLRQCIAEAATQKADRKRRRDAGEDVE